jgi:hypothetical protein
MARLFTRSLVVCLLALLILACPQKTETPADTSATPTAEAPVATQAPPAPVQPGICKTAKDSCGQLSQCAVSPLGASAATIPTAPCTLQGEADPRTQELVDIYSWNLFVALNWPGNSGNCVADTNKNIMAVKSGDGTYTTWQTYMPSEKVFVSPSAKPAAWCSGNGLLGAAPRVFDNIAKAAPQAKLLGGDFLKISEPGGDVLQAKGGVLTDQSQRWVRYERLMNQIEYNYIAPDKWNTNLLKAMVASNTPIQIPTGAIEIKSAWKVLTGTEIQLGRYFTTKAYVCNTPDGTRTPCNAQPVTLGLVGLHLVQQRNTGGTMFWSTFEHVDNEKVFFNPASNATPNTNLAKQPYTELDSNCKGLNIPTQVKRVTPVPAAAELNKYYQEVLAGSVFANYQIVSTQWTTGVGVTRLGTPQHVANITLETYAQTATAKSGATGCMACHLTATTKVATATGLQDSNHSFFFLEAQ